MSVKFPYSGYGGGTKSDNYNYKKLWAAEKKFPTEKQMKYFHDVKRVCEQVGINLDDMELKANTKTEISHSINAMKTILAKNGYDGFGNPIKTYNLKEVEDK